jgi:hypothetical protein
MWISFFVTERARTAACESLAGYRIWGANSRPESRRMTPQLDLAFKKIPFPQVAGGYRVACPHASVCERDEAELSTYDKPERTFISSITLLRNQRGEAAEFP